jgi:hypothetical protein
MTLTAPLLGPRRHQWPTWLVSAKHRTLVRCAGESDWSPLGAHHARQAGESLTACGVVAIGWPVFWLMPFDTGAPASCPDCIAAVISVNADPGSQSQQTRRPACC